MTVAERLAERLACILADVDDAEQLAAGDEELLRKLHRIELATVHAGNHVARMRRDELRAEAA